MWAFLIPILKAMGVGAAVGAGTSAVTGGDVKKGALMGAAGGGLTGGFGALLGKGGSAAVTAAEKAKEAEKVAAALKAKQAADAALALKQGGATLAATAPLQSATTAIAKEAAKPTFAGLMGDMTRSAGKGAAGTLGSAVVGSMVPTTGMTTPGNVPQMSIQDDTMAMLEKLMQQSKNKKGSLV